MGGGEGRGGEGEAKKKKKNLQPVFQNYRGKKCSKNMKTYFFYMSYSSVVTSCAQLGTTSAYSCFVI